jgi:hypothetical protein
MSFRIARAVLDKPGGRMLLRNLASAKARLRGRIVEMSLDDPDQPWSKDNVCAYDAAITGNPLRLFP